MGKFRKWQRKINFPIYTKKARLDMQYHDVYFGFYSQKWDDDRHHVENRFSTLDKLIEESLRWTRSDATRYTAITIQNKLIFACYWDGFGFHQRRFEND